MTISKKIQKSQDDKKTFSDSFHTVFNIKTLKSIYGVEFNKVKDLIKNEKTMFRDLNMDNVKFTKFFPASERYIMDNIFKSSDMSIYLTAMNGDGLKFPREISNIAFNTRYLTLFPAVIAHWFVTLYDNIFEIGCDNCEKRFYSERGIEYLNIFDGYAYEKFTEKKILNPSGVKFLHDHILNVLCNGNVKDCAFIESAVSQIVIGKKKLKVAVLLKGLAGIGKGLFMELLTGVLGKKNIVNIQDEDQAIGKFNGHFMGKTLAFYDDVSLSKEGFKSFGKRMKTRITEERLTFRDLFKSHVSLKNITSHFMASNEDFGALDETHKGRHRYLICKGRDVANTNEYNAKLASLCSGKDNSFYSDYYLYLKSIYSSSWIDSVEIQKLDVNENKLHIIQNSLPQIIKYIKYFVRENQTEIIMMKDKDIYDDYILWTGQTHHRGAILTRYDFIVNFKKNMDSAFYEHKDFKKIGGKMVRSVNIIKRKLLVADMIKHMYITEEDGIDEPIAETSELIDYIDPSEVDEYKIKIKAMKAEIEALKEQIKKKPKAKVSVPKLKNLKKKKASPTKKPKITKQTLAKGKQEIVFDL